MAQTNPISIGVILVKRVLNALNRHLSNKQAPTPKASIAQAALYQAKYDYLAAEATLQKAADKSPDSLELKIARIHNFEQMGKYVEALPILQQIRSTLDFKTEIPTYQFINPYVDILFRCGKLKELDQFFVKMIAAKTNNHRVILGYYRLMITQGKYQKAKTYLSQSLANKGYHKQVLVPVLLMCEEEKLRHIQTLKADHFILQEHALRIPHFLAFLEKINTYLQDHPRFTDPQRNIIDVFERYRDLAERYPDMLLSTGISLPETYEVASQILTHIEKRTPFSLIRLGDGEGHFLEYAEPLKHFQAADQAASQQIWWGQTLLTPDEWENIKGTYHAAIEQADILGIPGPYRCCKVFLWPKINTSDLSWEMRGLLAVINKAYTQAMPTAPHAPVLASPRLTSCHIHSHLEDWGFWDLILTEIADCSIISCHESLPHMLKERYGISIRHHYSIPPEYKYARQMGFDPNGYKPHYPDRFEEISTELTVAYPGEVFLVAAGFLGKIYCHLIKQQGGIALDVGSAVDYWLNFSTRKYTKSIKPPPYFLHAYNLLGHSLLKEKRSQYAQYIFQKLVELYPQSPLGYIGLGTIATNTKQWDIAQRRLQEALALNPHDIWVLYKLGFSLMETKQLEEAEDTFQHLLQKIPDKSLGYEGMAALALKNYHREEAISWYDKAIIHTQADTAYRPKARILIHHGQFEEGIEVLDTWLQQNGESSDRLKYKAELLIWAGQYAQAVEILEALHHQAPTSLSTVRLFARALIANQQFEQANQLIDQLPDSIPTSSYIEDPLYINKLLKTWQQHYQDGATSDNPKVFGIGLSRTGTTSLTDALTVLGYGAIHFFNPLPKRIIEWEDFFHFDAFTDSTVSFQFEKLYAAFPNAKFIYTEREMSAWVRSNSNLYKPRGFSSTIEFKAWLARPKSEQGKFDRLYHCHHPNYIAAYESLYARFSDWETAYHAYEDRVNRFFADKPADKLLRVDITKEKSWDKLCDFLDKPIPKAVFPHSNKSASVKKTLNKLTH